VSEPGRSRSITVLGGGAWGTALAIAARRAGHDVRLWARDAETVRSIEQSRQNMRYLSGITIDPAIRSTTDPSAALADAELVVAAVPAQQLRQALTYVAGSVPADATVILAAKGIEQTTGKLLSAVVAEILPGRPIAMLSGPSFASDLAKGLPTAVVIASLEKDRAEALARLLSTERFRCYSTDDLTGVEIGGALKNIFAIGAGTVAGAGLGASAQAALLTRGFVELRRIAAAFGARPETVMGLSGFGDLLLTCSTPQSRNYSYGLALGRGEPLDGRPLAEGVATTAIAAKLTGERGIQAPIVQAIDLLLERAITVDEAVTNLMTRPLRGEDE
jgi:glycerol-3-phosphate dehydrogenase (NAD(P)+)